jgi:hypothetical protein
VAACTAGGPPCICQAVCVYQDPLSAYIYACSQWQATDWDVYLFVLLRKDSLLRRLAVALLMLCMIVDPALCAVGLAVTATSLLINMPCRATAAALAAVRAQDVLL